MKTTPTSQAARPKGPQYSNDFFATGAALNDRVCSKLIKSAIWQKNTYLN